MRILITQKGSEFIEDLENLPKNKARQTRSISYDTTRTRFARSTRNTSVNKLRFKSPTQSLETSAMKDLAPLMKNAKKVIIKNGKVGVPKNFILKYEQTITEEDESKPGLISSSINGLPSIHSQLTSFSKAAKQAKPSFFSFQEIIPNQTLTNIKKKMLFDQRERDKLSRITEEQFRTIYEPKSKLCQLNEVLKCPKVNSNKISLIQYLNEKKNITPLTLQNLVTSEPERINKFNKLCQIIIHDKDKETLFKGVIQERIKQKFMDEKIRSQQKIEDMKEEVKISGEVLLGYNKKINKMDKYRDLHKEIEKHHWAKFNLERFNKKNNNNKNAKIQEDKE